MSTAMVVQGKQELANTDYSVDQVALVRDTIAKGCSELELKLFLQVAKIKRLDPFTGQIRPMKRWDSNLGRETMTVQTGIDGYRVIASRTGELAGSDDPVSDSEESEFPKWAKVTVYRWSRDQRIPYTSTARWSEYVQRKKSGEVNSMWTRMPYLMLGKVAEALALRKAFPDELSGIYTFEEMGQAENPEPQPPAGNKKAPIQQPQRASEKGKQETAAQTQAAPNPAPPAEAASEEGKTEGTVLISGKIDSMKPGKDNSLWMYVGSKLLVVFENKINDDMKVGNVITVKGLRIQSKKVGEYFEVFSVMENPAVVETPAVVNTEADEAFEKLGTEPPAESPAPTIDALKASGAVTTANNISAPKTIGLNQAKRLYAMMSQNSKTTGLTEEIVKKELLPTLIPPIEHLRDLDVKHKTFMERIMTGEIDWKEYLKG